MDAETKSNFCRQLANWAEVAIERGRYPFRKVEVSPLLLTAGGLSAPDLVFWINRDSFMTGGLLLTPDQETDQVLEEAQQCAMALGVRHFVVWSQRAVHIWEESGGKLLCRQRFPLPAGGDVQAADFQAILKKILDELKLLSVLGAIPAEKLSPYYLANLCRYTLQQAQPILADAFRLARGERRLHEDLAAEILAERKGLLTLWRLLALLSHDLMPMNVRPDGLERAMCFAADGLPALLAEILRQPPEEVRIPAEGAILFHSLCHRLLQIPLRQEPGRVAQVLDVLLQAERTKLGGFSSPAATDAEKEPLWLLYPDRPELPEGNFVEIGPSSYLAGAALWRTLCRETPPVATAGDLFALAQLPPPMALRGSLCDSRPLASALRHQYSAMLRLSWPTRRFNLPAHTPRWLWESLHLLGCAAPQASFNLQIPAAWLTADYGTSFFELLRSQFSLEMLEGEPQGLLRLRFYKGDRSDLWTTFTGPHGVRRQRWAELREAPRSRYLLNLALPEAFMVLLDKGLLAIRTSCEQKTRGGIELYLRSSLGSWLWDLVSASRPLPTAATLLDAIVRQGLPCPSDQVLQALHRACAHEKTPSVRIDQELSRLLGSLPQVERSSQPTPTSTPTNSVHGASSEEIVREIFMDGIPRFPEQYLYNYYRPELQSFSFTGRLAIADEFFGRITLHESSGTAIEVDNHLTALALQLASQVAPSPVSLPIDRQICADITERYLSDLLKLRQELLRRTHLSATESRTADLLAKRIWKELPLPDWALLDSKVPL